MFKNYEIIKSYKPYSFDTYEAAGVTASVRPLPLNPGLIRITCALMYCGFYSISYLIVYYCLEPATNTIRVGADVPITISRDIIRRWNPYNLSG